MHTRHFVRVDFNAVVSIAFDNNVIICNTNNLSLQGMYLRTAQKIPLNMPVHVTVYHSKLSSVKAKAKVVRVEDHGVGLQIDSLDVLSFVKLRNLVAKNINNQVMAMEETLKMIKCIQ